MQRINTPLLYLIALALLVGVTWGLYQANLGFARANPGGYDLLARWGGGRAVLEFRGNPYSEEVTAEIQRLYYGGRTARANEDQVLFAYPYYVLALVAPFAITEDFVVARAAWMTLLEISLLVIALVSLRWAEWRPRPLLLGGYVLFSVLWYLAVRGVILGNPAVMVALFIALALFAIQRQADEWAGICLALATIKPQMVVVLLAFVLAWALMQRRVRILTAFAIALGVLVGFSFWLEPAWFGGFLRQVAAYPGYTHPATPAGIMQQWWGHPGLLLGWGLSAAVALLVLRDWAAVLRRPVELFPWGAALALVATFLVGVPNPTANQLALLPVLPLLFALWQERWPQLAPWLTAACLLLLGGGLWWLHLATLLQADQPTENLILHFPLPLFLLLALYWMRWWALHPHRRMPLEKIKALGRL